MLDVNTSLHGPLFNGQVDTVLDAFAEAGAQTVGDEAVDMIRIRLGAVLQNPTGAYEARISSLAQGERAEVTDNNAIYGSWLEGTSSRNSATRFKGYATFRKVLQELDGRAADIAQRDLPAYLARLQ